ncbi:MAG: endonuclease/exonuclease/phosphatase family protein [Leptospirales bacterium]|nr:endonuclease/exonuclease/phosphatase family protein [Leptospirales bacterium]
MELTFVTYNIHKGIGNDGRYRLERIVEVLRDIDADVVALQEVDHNAPRSRSEDTARILAEELGMHYHLGLNVKLKHGAYGNATLSRYPILESRNMNITWAIKKRRGCLITRIQCPRHEIGVMNFHLGLASFERQWQARKILNSHSLKSLNRLPLIILGDSNDRNDRLRAPFEAAGLSDASADAQKAYTWPSYAPLFRLDKVFYSGHWRLARREVVQNKKTRVASDHLPLAVTFSLGR